MSWISKDMHRHSVLTCLFCLHKQVFCIISGWKSILFAEPPIHCRMLLHTTEVTIHEIKYLLTGVELCLSSVWLLPSLQYYQYVTASSVRSCFFLWLIYNGLTVVVSWRGAHSTVILPGSGNPDLPPAAWGPALHWERWASSHLNLLTEAKRFSFRTNATVLLRLKRHQVRRLVNGVYSDEKGKIKYAFNS